MADKYNVRWAIKASEWKPTSEEALAVSSYMQVDEKEKISRFVFQNDAKSSLLGRLLMRKYVHTSTGIPYKDVCLGRDSRTKPCLLNGGDSVVNFNVSHQGDYVVLAGNKDKNIGIDVMKIEPPANKNIPEFLCLMRRQFSSHEWQTMNSFSTDMEKVACFYRFWCLKESYVKNTGLGLNFPLNEISFSLKTLQLPVGDLVTDTKFYLKNVLMTDWLIEETRLDEAHTVAVALQVDPNSDYTSVPYTFLTFKELTQEAEQVIEPDKTFSDNFLKKEIKKF